MLFLEETGGVIIILPPGYLILYRKGILKERVEEAQTLLRSCRICPRACERDRVAGETGYCGASPWARVASANLHWGEEPPLVGRGGSGTIFFSYCSLRCCFCQNYPISHLGNGNEVKTGDLARMMLDLQAKGAVNLNLVTGSHYLPQILEALSRAIEGGFRLPLVYNCSGYESMEALRLLEGIVDIYLPDIKYGKAELAGLYSRAPDYVEVNRTALREMYRQVGFLQVDSEGIARRGLIVRHLILPGQLENTREAMAWLKNGLSPHVHISLMSQYFPACEAKRYPGLRRRVRREEVKSALEIVRTLGLELGWRQEKA